MPAKEPRRMIEIVDEIERNWEDLCRFTSRDQPRLGAKVDLLVVVVDEFAQRTFLNACGKGVVKLFEGADGTVPLPEVAGLVKDPRAPSRISIAATTVKSLRDQLASSKLTGSQSQLDARSVMAALKPLLQTHEFTGPVRERVRER